MTGHRARHVLAVGMALLVSIGCRADPGVEPTTAPPTANTSSFATPAGDLLVVGDWGSGTMPQGAVAGAMMR